MRSTRALCLAVTAVAALGLTACGGAGTSSSSAGAVAAPKMASVADAMALTTKQATAYTSMKISMTEVLPKIGTVTASGSVSRNPIAMDLAVSNPELAQELGNGSIRMLLSGGVMYMDMGDKGAQELGGKHWMKMDFASLGSSGQAMATMMNQSSGQDPATAVKLLTSSGTVSRVGQETVDGVGTTHYSGVVDLKKLIAQGLGGADDASLKTIVDQASGLGMATENIDLWVNAQNLPVRVHETASSSEGPLDITIDYSDFSNTPLTVTPPPVGDTVDFAQMLKQGQSG